MMASVEEHLKYKVWQANLGMLVARRLGFKHNKYIRSLTTVIDLQGLGTRHAFRPFLSIFNQGNKLIQSLYPEVMHQIVIINAPTIFTVLFPLVKAFLSKRVISKIRVISETDYFPLLAELIDPQYIPKYLGGTAPDPANDVRRLTVPGHPPPPPPLALSCTTHLLPLGLGHADPGRQRVRRAGTGV